jgi:hypothetical protein
MLRRLLLLTALAEHVIYLRTSPAENTLCRSKTTTTLQNDCRWLNGLRTRYERGTRLLPLCGLLACERQQLNGEYEVAASQNHAHAAGLVWVVRLARSPQPFRSSLG